MSIKIQDFIKGDVYYYSNHFFCKGPFNHEEILAQIRGYGSITKMFNTIKEVNQFQDELGQFIAEAINEKLQREKGNEKLS